MFPISPVSVLQVYHGIEKPTFTGRLALGFRRRCLCGLSYDAAELDACVSMIYHIGETVSGLQNTHATLLGPSLALLSKESIEGSAETSETGISAFSSIEVL